MVFTAHTNKPGVKKELAFGTGSFFMQWTAFGLRKTTIKVSDFIQNCSHPQFTLQMLGASSCPPSPGTEAIQ